MTAATKGVYITLTCMMYEAEAPLHQSWDMLARRCGATLPAFRKAIEALQDDNKMLIVDGGLWSPKCDKHIALRRERQKSAKAAAEIRWQKSQQKQSTEDAGAYDPQCYSEPEPEEEKREAYASQKKARGMRLPEDWFLPMEWGEWAISEGMDRDAVRVQADRFKDYWLAKAGKDATKLDWQATWRNWIRSAKERGNGNGNRGGVRQREGAAFGRAIHQLADGLSAGTVKLDVASRDPFA